MSTLTHDQVQKLLDELTPENGEKTSDILFDNHNQHTGNLAIEKLDVDYACIDSFIDYDVKRNKILIYHPVYFNDDVSSYYRLDINDSKEYDKIINMKTEELNQYVIDNATTHEHFDHSDLDEKIQSVQNIIDEDQDDEYHEKVMSNMSEGERRLYKEFLNDSY